MPDELPEQIRVYLSGGPEDLVVERPLRLRIGDTSLVTMRTPGLETEWALGFLRSEGWIESAADVVRVAFAPSGDSLPGIGVVDTDTVQVQLREAPRADVQGRLSRVHEIRASCGVCGTETAEQLLQGIRPLPVGVPRVSLATLRDWLAVVKPRQHLFSETGGSHAAALFRAQDGALLAVAEDIGRHNALDKVLGLALKQGIDFGGTVVFLSGRSGYELVIKCLRVGIPAMVSVGATSSLAYDLASKAGATLIGFFRGETQRVYCDNGRIVK